MKKFTNDHRVRVTQTIIRKAFLGLLNTKPIQSISIKELCERAGISRGTFYAHYTDLHDLLRQIEGEMTAEIEAALEPLLARTPANPVVLSARIFEILRDNSDLCTVVLGEHGDKQFAARLVRMGYEKCIDRYRSYFRDVPAREIEYYFAFVSMGIMGLLRRWLADGMTATPEELAQFAEGLMLRGAGVFAQ
ncbi:MAG: TetR/AcrR family transcriptional regulator [Oscillospiraceae bacterium]|nr:TetR/AcrR family transcriptional regulator [Oscillospiraceae bacterium]